MRRNEKEITDKRIIERILDEAILCRVALCDGGRPYIIPMNYGYRDGCLYLHSADEGKKIDILKKNPNLCFEVDIECELRSGKSPCNWSMKYNSVIGFGKAVFVDEPEEKKESLDVIVEKYIGRSGWDYGQKTMERLAVIKVNIEEMTGKTSKG